MDIAPASGRRVLVIGLDCAPPALVFDRYRHVMPNVGRLMAEGSYGPLRSTTPPITIPAWTSMLSGHDPGQLGLYGFSRQVAGSYETVLTESGDIGVPRVWEVLQAAGKRVAPLFVPPTYPPSAVDGAMVSCFMTPGADQVHTHPPELGAELSARFGPYIPDVVDFRTDDRARVLSDLTAMTEQHFDIARHVWTTVAPDFMVLVEMGPDRLHHVLWQAIDPSHPGHDPSDPLLSAGEQYYGLLDRQIGALLSEVDDETPVLVVSDHGARALRGGVCINEWLVREGYLVLREQPTAVTALSDCDVDWERTRAWAAGGYCGRVYLNRSGLRPKGHLDDAACTRLADELAEGLRAIETPHSDRPHRVLQPHECYPQANGVPPDLSVFFGDLDLRAIASIGHGSLTITGNDTGPDGCNHDWDGIFVLSGGGQPARGELSGLSILDVTPTILSLMGVEAPAGLSGVDRSMGA